ncbi:uncharacterized protein J4E78_000770 [Alternaria triticimaculans]|uniref:uncharacterized protein n=1 Tax=Alternaria triticimaculans TaxID=297637 RepID=UPI0020C39E60|nr:uncharacterized protein J4E78_000770 [Alternaria triticimaculans]KAI4672270.1 hypothetical protein J4E78_000770 [Alternaria triticimaculans]
MATSTRQPFAELGSSRLQVLQSAKNRQNALTPNFASQQGLKSIPTPSTGKRQRAPEIFEDADSENMDPSIFNSPTKKSKTASHSDAGYIKPANFSIFTSAAKPSASSLNATPSVPSVRKALSSPNTAKSTPISTSRGSPKNKRLHAVSKRRASSSPFRRVDPPSFTQSSPSLPFSIDAALSGSISTYTPKAPTVAATPVSAPAPQTPIVDDSMPKSWFFEIHEDTPEQEAANLMEHSASVLDISSDDDAKTKASNEDRGKENVPPPDFLAQQTRKRNHASSFDDGYETDILADMPVKQPRLRKFVQDAMDEDRRPLGDLAPSEFYAEGCDATSYVTVDAGIEKPSRLSNVFDASCVTPEKKKSVVVEDVPAAVEEETTLAEEVAAAPAAVEVPAVETVVETTSQTEVPAAAS